MERLQSTLLAHLRQVADFRKARGQRFAWGYLLALVAAAIAAGQTTVVAMVAWATTHKVELLVTLQPGCPRIPSAATWRRLVVHIDIAASERLVAAHNQMLDQADPLPGRIELGDGQIGRGSQSVFNAESHSRAASASRQAGISPD